MQEWNIRGGRFSGTYLKEDCGGIETGHPCGSERTEESAARRRVPFLSFSLGHDQTLCLNLSQLSHRIDGAFRHTRLAVCSNSMEIARPPSVAQVAIAALETQLVTARDIADIASTGYRFSYDADEVARAKT